MSRANLKKSFDLPRVLDTTGDRRYPGNPGGWLGQHAQDLHNPFGLTNAGRDDLNFKSYADAQDYWMYKAGRTGDGYADVIQGAGSISEFALALKDAGYNNKTGTWAKDVINQLKSIDKWMGICNITQ